MNRQVKRHVYLHMKPLAEARDLFLGAFDWNALAASEEIDTVEAQGRVTAEPVFAALSVPGYHAAAMDGFAVEVERTYGATDQTPVRLRVGEQAFAVNTGDPLPEGTQAVVMIEQVHQPEEGVIELRSAAFAWQHVRRVGEDVVAGEMLLPHHHMIDPADVAALLSAGVFRLPVKVVPRVAVVPTGTELVDWREAAARKPLPPGAIIETNSVFLAGLVRRAGAIPEVMPRCPDRPEALAAAVKEALAAGAHLVIVNAGASAGTEDHTANVLADLGTVIAHGITVMPGKPTILASVQGRPVVGSPGYPVSAWVCFEELVAPALAMLRGQPPPERETVTAIPARRLASKLGQEEHVRVHLGRVGERIIATPLKRGAGIITSLTRADGIVRIPDTSEGIDEGTEVQAQLLRPRSAVERTLVVVGSHDVTLDLLADQIKRIAPKVHMSSSNLGSLAGLMAIAAGRCHLGGTHLLDPETGEYNVSYVRQVLPDTRVRLVTLALRQQGLMIKRGNPRGIKGLEDLGRPDIRFVNRQPGSGTRVLLDYHLAQIGLAAEAVRGYEDDEYTHTAVAVRVLAGGADAGLGVLAAARALGLDFIPVAEERYDLCIPVAYLEDERVQALLAALDAPAFRRAVEGMGGYDITPMGTTAWEG